LVVDWNPNIFVSWEPRQNLGTLRQLSPGDLADDKREEERITKDHQKGDRRKAVGHLLARL
jgi:hypothetical protein